MLEEDGLIAGDERTGYTSQVALQTGRIEELQERLAAGIALAGPAGELLLATGPELAHVFCGEQDPLALLFPGGSTATAEALYKDSPASHYFGAMVRSAVEAFLT